MEQRDMGHPLIMPVVTVTARSRCLGAWREFVQPEDEDAGGERARVDGRHLQDDRAHRSGRRIRAPPAGMPPALVPSPASRVLMR
jgi:hypothetical protein